MFKSDRNFLIIILMLFTLTVSYGKDEPVILLRYAHMNPVESVAGLQARYFADLVNRKTQGRVRIEVYPASQIGSIKDMLSMVTMGQIAIHHTTMAGLGDLYEDFAVFDTPYIYRDLNHVLNAAGADSELIKKFNEELKNRNRVRVLYTFYFGTRHLTSSKIVKTPDDLKGVKIRAIPFPMYMAAVEGLGAVPAPLDFSDTYDAISAGIVSGQENPLDTIYSARLFEVQRYLVLTGHIMGMEAVIFNEDIWNKLPKGIQNILNEAADEVSRKATKMTIESEKALLEKLRERKMTVIGINEGLAIDKFKSRTNSVIKKKFMKKYSKYYEIINKIK